MDTKVKGGFRTKSITVADGVRTTELIWKDASYKEIGREFDPSDTYDPRKRPWYIQAQQAGTTIWTEPYIFFTSEKPGLTAASPVFSEQGELTGVVFGMTTAPGKTSRSTFVITLNPSSRTVCVQSVLRSCNHTIANHDSPSFLFPGVYHLINDPGGRWHLQTARPP